MTRLAPATAVVVMLSLPLVAGGHGLTLVRSGVAVACYYPAPILYVPVVAPGIYPLCVPPPVCPSLPQPSAPGRPYAPPTAAPPSAGPSTPEPPLAAPPAPAQRAPAPPSRTPGLGESTSFFDTYPVAAPASASAAGGPCKVVFWNLTGRDLVLRMDGEPPRLLPRGQSLAVATGRQLTWQIEGRETQTTRIASDESALQIVIRR